MQTRETKKKIKKPNKKKNKINKKNIGFYIFALKCYKIFRILFTSLIIFFLGYLSLSIYKSDSLKKIYNKISLTYSNILYKNICVNVDIIGINRANLDKIQENVYNYCNLENKNDLNILLASLKNDPWIKSINIKRNLPDTLTIFVEEFLPFAILKDDEKLYLIDENGKTIEIDEKEKRGYYNLLIVAGKESKENIYSLFNLLSSNPNLFSRIKSAMLISQRRWDLELDNGILIKMPEKNILDAWYKLDKILSIRGSEIGLKIIDLRNNDKVFLEEI